MNNGDSVISKTVDCSTLCDFSYHNIPHDCDDINTIVFGKIIFNTIAEEYEIPVILQKEKHTLKINTNLSCSDIRNIIISQFNLPTNAIMTLYVTNHEPSLSPQLFPLYKMVLTDSCQTLKQSLSLQYYIPMCCHLDSIIVS